MLWFLMFGHNVKVKNLRKDGRDALASGQDALIDLRELVEVVVPYGVSEECHSRCDVLCLLTDRIHVRESLVAWLWGCLREVT